MTATDGVPDDLRRLAIAFADDAKPLADALTGAIYAEIPGLGAGGDEQAVEELRRSAEANIELVFRMLAEGRDAQPADTPQQALDHARSLVRRGASLAVVLRAYRLGHALAWERLAAAIAESVAPADQPPLLARSSRHMFGYIDAICDRIVDEHEAERARWVRSAAAARADVVRAILDASPVDRDAASRTLGYELRRHHLGLVLWRDAGAGDVGGLEEAACALVAAAGFDEPLLLVVGTLLWGWVGAREVPDEAALELLRATRLEPDVHASLGEPAADVDGFRETHEEALNAHRMACLAGRRGGSVIRYRAVELEALLAADLPRARRFVARELGALAADDDATTRLRATLQVFLEENASNVRTGRRLGIHQNTVAYRVTRAEELLERPATQRRLRLQVALQLAQALRAAGDGGP
ncbi:MAG TPA: helix-turn-helix domain-containing protein [Solirubrobacteraceae bacterium]|nr:helix-turn-helix domain-containing protein [Solirubrobacteraceae bacterium]